MGQGIRGAIILLSVIVMAAQAQAQCVRAWYVPPREVAEKSGIVCVGRIDSIRTVPADPDPETGQTTPIYTEISFRIEKIWKGDAALEGCTHVFRQTGGKLGEITTVGEPFPDYRPGQRWLWGLVHTPQGWWTTYGIRHGAFRVDGETAARDFTGFEFIDGTTFDGPEKFKLDDLKFAMIGTAPTSTPIPNRVESRDDPRPVSTKAPASPKPPSDFKPASTEPGKSSWRLFVGLPFIGVALWLLWKSSRGRS